MGKWSRNKVNSANLNNGNEYEAKDRLSRQQLNAIINSGLYSQDFAEHLADTPDTSEINNVGIPSVEFVDNPNATLDKPYKRFKFSNLKGEKGDMGATGPQGIQGIQGEKGQDGVSVLNATVGTPTISVNETITPINFELSNGTTYTVNVSAQKGEKGDKGDAGTFDTELSTTSTNGVQNKVITNSINNLSTELSNRVTEFGQALSSKFDIYRANYSTLDTLYEKGLYELLDDNDSTIIRAYCLVTATDNVYNTQFLFNGWDAFNVDSTVIAVKWRYRKSSSWSDWQTLTTNTNLANCASKTLSNVSYPTNTIGSTTTGTADRVVETYISSDGLTWYRKYASGWIIQGGRFNSTGNNSTYTLPKAFTTNTYTVILQQINDTKDSYNGNMLLKTTQANSYFTINSYNAQTLNFIAFGY